MEIEISKNALSCLKHMLGASEGKQKKNFGNRNYFAAGKGQIEAMDELVNAGFATRGGVRGELTYYHANGAGCDKAGLHKAAKLRALNDA